MHSRTIVRPPAPTGERPLRTRTLGITQAVLRGARQRARRLTLAAVAFTCAMAPMGLLLQFTEGLAPRSGQALVVGLACGFVLSLGVFLYVRREATPEGRALFAAMLMGILGCALTGMMHAIHEHARFGHVSPFGPYALLLPAMPLVLLTPPRLTVWLCGLCSLSVLTACFVADTLDLAALTLVEYAEIAGVLLGASTLGYVSNLATYGLQKEVARARHMGSYQLVARIGAGGMGEVWRAKHDMLARPAAVKLIQPERMAKDPDGQEAATQRFAREAQATAALESPHTVRLFDFGRTQDGTFYYAMELLDGIDLEQLVAADGPQPVERVRAIMLQVCESIAEAHALGLVHRDIKPGNIMLCKVGRHYDFVKVLDFGLVALQPEIGPESDDDRLTRVGQVVGTPGFMAPESLMGAPNDARSDVYALGCLMFFLLTGRRVFRGKGYAEIARAHLTGDIPSLYEAGARRATGAWQQVVSDCLQKDAELRPETVDDLLDRLEALPVTEPWTPARAQDWWAATKALELALQPTGTHPPTVAERPGAVSG